MRLLDLDIEDDSRYRPSAAPLTWGTAVGAWGDCLVCAGIFEHLVGYGGLIVFSRDRGIADMMAVQRFVGAVRFVEPIDEADYDELSLRLNGPIEPGDPALRELADRAGVPVERVVRTHVDAAHWNRKRAFRWSGVQLPAASWEWASRTASELPPFYLLHPFSLNSSDWRDNWQHWQQALLHLLTFTPHHFVLTGHGWDAVGSHPRVTNLMGRAPDMTALFALAHMARGVITTSNSLAIYAAMAGLPAIACGNRPLSRPDSVWRTWMEAPSVDIVRFEDGPGAFVQAVNRMMHLR